MKKPISDMNIRVTIKQWDENSQDDAGGSSRTLVNSWIVWANKKDPSGNQIANEAQQNWSYSTVFKVRYRVEFKSNFTLTDSTGNWTINSVSVSEAGYKEFMFLNCTKIDGNIS